MGGFDFSQLTSLFNNPGTATKLESPIGKTGGTLNVSAEIPGSGALGAIPGSMPGNAPAGQPTGWYGDLSNWMNSPKGRAAIGMMGNLGGMLVGGEPGAFVSGMGRNMAAGAGQEVERQRFGKMLQALLGGGGNLNF